MYCTSSRQQFAVIHNMQCLPQSLQFSSLPITFVQFPHKRVLTIVLPLNGCHSTSKLGNIICTENIYTVTIKVENEDIESQLCIMNYINLIETNWFINTNIYTLEIIP